MAVVRHRSQRRPIAWQRNQSDRFTSAETSLQDLRTHDATIGDMNARQERTTVNRVISGLFTAGLTADPGPECGPPPEFLCIASYG